MWGWHAAPAVHIGPDDARVDREALAADQPFRDAALHDRLKELAERIAVAEPAVSVLRQDEEVWLHDSSITWLFSR